MKPTSSPAPRTIAAGLLQRRECLVPTWRGWLAFLLIAGVLVGTVLRFACVFLTVNDPTPGGVLVVEGWVAPDETREVLAEFQRRPYTGIYITGGPIEAESPLAAYGTYAELTADVLRRAGADPVKVHAISGPKVAKDRTYSTAVALKIALLSGDPPPTALNLMTGATHSRRSRLLYQAAFGPTIRIGTISLPEREFDPARWWTTSAGFRAVTSELLAYFYARLFFRPS